MELYFDSGIFIIGGLSGLVFIIAAVVMIQYPPKKINTFYGYRTKSSMQSKKAWDFAQQYSAKKMLLWGIIIIAFSILSLLFNFGETVEFIAGMIAMSIGIGVPIYQTEKELKRKFSIHEKDR
jgi:uncharacterized membrane protein